MQQNYTTTKTAGLGQNVGPGYPPNASWDDPNGITGAGDPAFIGFFEGGQGGDLLVASQFGFDLPDFAVVDGVSIDVTGSQTGCHGYISLSVGTEPKESGAFPQTYGNNVDLWGAEEITPAAINDSSFGMNVALGDVSGGDGIAEVSLIEITVYWHVELTAAPADVPTRVVYKTYTHEGRYLGELPDVDNPFAFAQDINSAGATIDVVCARKAENTITTEPLLTDDDEPILTDDDLPILADDNHVTLATADSPTDAIFKNSNRIKVWMYNHWHPNGKLMFSGQVNKVSFQYGGSDSSVKLHVISDGLDTTNLVVRGFPFNYTTDVSQTSQTTYSEVTQGSGLISGLHDRWGQTWLTGPAVTNVGAIDLRLQGAALVTLEVYDNPNGNLLGSATKQVSNASAAVVQFEFPQLIPVESSRTYFWAVQVNEGQTIRVYRSNTNVYANGTRYRSQYAGGSGGGSWQTLALQADFYFVTKYGTPTTTATYSNQDPITGIMSDVLKDYNARGGYIKERNFQAAGHNLTYTFNVAFIFDALKSMIEVAPPHFYSYIDLGDGAIDILPVSQTADFTVVRGRDVNQLDLVLSIEQVKNYFLFTGGEVSPGVNLFREYSDTNSISRTGIRTGTRGNNRVVQVSAANAIGDRAIEEEASETQETSVTVLSTTMDTTLLTPGKTIGFRNFGHLIDSMVLQIVRREFNTASVTLTLGRMPLRMSDELQRINLDVFNEQTVNNPSAPS